MFAAKESGARSQTQSRNLAMPPAASALSAKMSAALHRLADRPGTVLALLLAGNALVQPYRGLYHDARLYAAQVVERVAPGTFADDLFLRYGSQDRYSVFTPLMAPLVRSLGVEPAFFLVYLACKALFFWALLRLVFVFVPDRVAALLALVYLAMSPLPFGGCEVIRLNESFLTPRIPGCALVLFALERALSGRTGTAAALLAAAVPLHPLMACAGILVVLLWWLATRLKPHQMLALTVVGSVAGSALVFIEPLGARVFGHIDDEWRAVVFQQCFFVQPALWTAGDWLRIAISAGVAIVAARTYGRRWSALLWALLAAGALGLVGSFVAAQAHYLLLLQVSPYRTLWLLELLAIPFGFWGCAWLWRRGDGASRCATCLLALLLTTDWNFAPLPAAWLFLGLLPACLVFHRGLGRVPAKPDWLAAAGATAFVLCVGGMLAFDVYILGLALATPVRFDLDAHAVLVLQASGTVLYKLPLLLGLAGAAALLAGRVAWRLPAALLGCWLAYQAGLTWADASAAYHRRFSARAGHEQFVTDFLRARAEPGRRRTVYWTADLGAVWFRAGANCYFHSVQMSGCAFSRGTALEGRRRGDLVGRFEADWLRREPLPEGWWQMAYLGFFNVPQEELPPTEADLRALCAEEGLDFVVLEQGFEGLYCAGDGRFFIYDCRQLRAGRASPCQPPASGLR
jgi:hypothetical protein